MQKLKFDLSNLPGVELLTKEQMKKVMGGLSSSSCGLGFQSCVTTSDCPTNQGCQGVPGCCAKTLGDSCTSNSQCGNGQTCVDKPAPFSGKWCNYNVN